MSRGSSKLLPNLVRFGRLLRRLGLGTTTAEVETLVHAVEKVGLHDRGAVKDAARTVLVHRREHLAIFDLAFDLFFAEDALAPRRKIDLGRTLRRIQKQRPQLLVNPPADGKVELPETETPIVEKRRAASGRELLRRKDFAELSPQEEAAIRKMMQEEVLELPPRRTRRRVPARRGDLLDLRAALKGSLRTGGETVRLPWRRRKVKRRPLVVLCDISGSMEVYSRIFLQFVVTLRRATDRLEVFVFGTRLTRITRELDQRHVEQALRDATAAIVDWGGGTRIGESLKTFHHEWSRRVLGQGAVVVVISDGWERGDPELLGRQMARLRRRSDRLLWLNPLLGSPGYEPLTRGIREVLPHVDDFLPVHNLESLEHLGQLLGELAIRR